jgi:tryptophan synthase alpha chain
VNQTSDTRLDRCLADLSQTGRKALIAYLVGGYPDLPATLALARTVLDHGADILEIGLPFSDPCADGPVIQSASALALAGGTTPNAIFQLIRELRRTHPKPPVILLLYTNTLYHAGLEPFFATCRHIGVDGVIVPDLPLEESDEACQVACTFGITVIRLVTPLSQTRLPALLDQAGGFIYCVASLGTTGERTCFETDLHQYACALAALTDRPRALGFGLSTPAQLRALAPDWDGLIVGSALVRRIGEAVAAECPLPEICRQLADLIDAYRQTIDASLTGSESEAAP